MDLHEATGLIYQRELRNRGVLNILTSKYVWHRSRVRFFGRSSRKMAPHQPLASFQPSGTAKHWKNKILRDLSPFSRTCILFLRAVSSLTLSKTTASAKVGSWTSNFPSILSTSSIKKIWETYSRVWLWRLAVRANPLLDRKVVGVVLLKCCSGHLTHNCWM